MRFESGGITRLNRHDRKRGMQPTDTTCWYCKQDLAIVGVIVWAPMRMTGFLTPGSKDGFVDLVVFEASDKLVEIECGECHMIQGMLSLDSWDWDPNLDPESVESN